MNSQGLVLWCRLLPRDDHDGYLVLAMDQVCIQMGHHEQNAYMALFCEVNYCLDVIKMMDTWGWKRIRYVYKKEMSSIYAHFTTLRCKQLLSSGHNVYSLLVTDLVHKNIHDGYSGDICYVKNTKCKIKSAKKSHFYPECIKRIHLYSFHYAVGM